MTRCADQYMGWVGTEMGNSFFHYLIKKTMQNRRKFNQAWTTTI